MDRTATRKGFAASLAISSAFIFAVSAIVHLLIAVAVVRYAAPAPFEVEPEAGIEVELVAPDEAKPEEKPQEKPQEKPEEKPDEKPELKLDLKDEPTPEPAKDRPRDQAKAPPPSPPPPPPPSQAPPPMPAQPPVPAPAETPPPAAADQPAAEMEPPFSPEMMAQMSKLNRPGDFDEAATEKAKLTADEIAAFRAAIQKCWTAPPGVAAEPRLKVVIQVSFKPSGALAGEPMLIAGTASPLGPALMRAAQAAVRRCQPYTVLPPAKYQEWRVLDLPFTPDGISGG